MALAEDEVPTRAEISNIINEWLIEQKSLITDFVCSRLEKDYPQLEEKIPNSNETYKNKILSDIDSYIILR